MNDLPGKIPIIDNGVIEHVDADGVRKIVKAVLSSCTPEFTAYLSFGGRSEIFDQSRRGDGLIEFKQQILSEWREDDEPKTVIIVAQDGGVVSIMQTCGSPANCAIIDADGGWGMFRVEYVLDAQGKYQRTKIREMLL